MFRQIVVAAATAVLSRSEAYKRMARDGLVDPNPDRLRGALDGLADGVQSFVLGGRSRGPVPPAAELPRDAVKRVARQGGLAFEESARGDPMFTAHFDGRTFSICFGGDTFVCVASLLVQPTPEVAERLTADATRVMKARVLGEWGAHYHEPSEHLGFALKLKATRLDTLTPALLRRVLDELYEEAVRFDREMRRLGYP